MQYKIDLPVDVIVVSKYLCSNLRSNEISPGIIYPVSCVHIMNEHAIA
jgi:hypothetical protein